MTKILIKITSSKKSNTKELGPNILKSAKRTMKLNRQQLVHICELPNEVLEKILDNINIKYWSRIRTTCRRLRGVCDSKIRHEFRTTFKRLAEEDPNGYQLAIMRLLKDMSSVYIQAGFESIFYGAFLPIIKKQTQLFPPPMELIKPFLLKFYSLVEQKLGRVHSQKSNLLYILTLLSTLKKCKNCRLVSSKSLHFSDWYITFELRDFWFGLLYSSEHLKMELESSRNQYDVLAILSEVLLTDYSNLDNDFKSVNRYIWEASRKVFVCGHKAKRKNSSPRIAYHLNMNGTKTVIDFIKNYFHDENSDNMDLSFLPKDDFDLNVKITCKEALNWGCCSDYSFNIGSSYLKYK